MKMDTQMISTWRRPSSGYVFNFAAAMLGLACLAVGLGAELRYRAGLDTSDALDHEGLWVFILAMLCQYLFRLIFWGRVPLHYQNLVRNLLSVLVAVELPIALFTVFLVATHSKTQTDDHVGNIILITSFTVLGTLCQISSVIWLLRHRKE